MVPTPCFFFVKVHTDVYLTICLAFLENSLDAQNQRTQILNATGGMLVAPIGPCSKYMKVLVTTI